MHSSRSQTGSVFIVALIFAAIVAIALTSYLHLAVGASRLANRSYYLNAAQNLVDTGLEQALWSLNNDTTTHPFPLNWTRGGFDNVTGSTVHKATFPSTSTYYALSGGVTGQVKVWLNQTDSVNDIWHAVALATVTLGDKTKINKYAEAYLQQRSLSAGGMITRNGVTFGGDVHLDSWISGGESVNTPYSIGVRRANARLASPSLIALQNADVYGYVSIGTDTITASSLTVGATGRVGNFGAANGSIDTTRVTYDFVGDFPNVQDVPTSGTALPGSVTAAGVTTVNVTASDTYYISNLDFTGGGSIDVLNIGSVGSPVTVTLVVPGWVDMGGGDSINIAPGSKLTMYVGGDFEMTGSTAQITNGSPGAPNNPAAFTLLGTRTEEQIAGGMAYQDWNLQGGTFLSAVIYAPNANLDVGGNAPIYGSLVANTVALGGTTEFHQDESLSNKRISGLYGLLKWRELASPADRVAALDYASWSTYLTP